MTRVNTNETARPNHKVWVWAVAGLVIVGLAGKNREPRGMDGARTGGYAPAAMRGYGDGFSPAAGGGASAVGADAPATAREAAPEAGGNGWSAGGGTVVPQGGGFVAPTPAAASDSGAAPTASGDSVPDSVNNNFDDYLRGQQRVVSENDGQTYIVDGNADPNKMTDTRDSVSGFSAAAPGSEAAGYADVAPSGATTPDTSTAAPVETSSAPAGE